MYNSQDEGNVCTKTQVTVAKALGWTPLWYINGAWKPYEGWDTNNIAINEENFPDENFRKWLAAQSYGKDNMLTPAEIAEVKEINVAFMEISSLKGIGYFTALTNLYCRYNKLTSLDLSKNIALEQLGCGGNQITALDVSKLTALKELYCWENQLATLNVTNNTALTILNCEENQLTALDVSKNTALTKLYCYNNKLESLDLSNNTDLNVLICHGNNIKGANMDALIASLPKKYAAVLYIITKDDTEGNVITNEQVAAVWDRGWEPYYKEGGQWYKLYVDIAINEENFPDYYFRRWLSQQDYGKDWVITQMERINVSEINLMEISEYTGDYIESLKGIENFRNLKSLWFALIPVTSLDLSKNIILEDLQYWAPITELDVSNNINLKILTCMGYKGECLTSLDLSNNWQLTELDCSENQLTGIDLLKNILLQKLRCYDNQLTTLDLSKTNEIDELKCYMNQIKDEGMDQFIASLTNRSIGETRFDVYYSGYDDTNDEYTVVDGNVMTKTQVAAAKKRGWVPYWYDDFDGKWKPYEGSGVDGDVNGDNVADVADIASIISVMAASIGDDIQSTAADLNHDGVVDVADIATVITIMAANARRLKIEH